MKLARPDVFHPRIVLAADPARPAGPPDDAGLVAALRARGLHARWLAWTDPATAGADLVILRAVGDHRSHQAEFADRIAALPQLLNPPPVLTWNGDKRYLLDLSDAGVPTVETTVFAPGQVVRVGDDVDGVVVAPAVGAGARRFDRADAAREHAHRLQASGQTVVIQPAQTRQRIALVFLGGAPSHALAAAAPVDADFGVWDVGQAALAAAAAQAGVGSDEILLARAVVADGAEGAGPQLLRLQLIDPVLGWTALGADARARHQRQFALAVESALQRRGLGPLSHRRP
ncbi:hypothetical protein BHQ15_07645 [Mycolicibacillus koreensis]|nr:hypothetical protein BHQ15_07645 [Mycolicibacillus koreensis]